MKTLFSLLTASALILGSASAWSANDDAAVNALMKKSNCFKCHSVDKKKDGPSYKSVAEKYKDKPDAAQTLHTHLTTHPMVEVGGNKEQHEALKTTNDADVQAVVKWILAR